MSEITTSEPVITVLTYPWQQIAIKDIHSIGTSPDPDAISFPDRLVYAVNIIGDKDKVCTFHTQSIEDRNDIVARINRAIQAEESLDVQPDPVVNRVK